MLLAEVLGCGTLAARAGVANPSPPRSRPDTVASLLLTARVRRTGTRGALVRVRHRLTRLLLASDRAANALAARRTITVTARHVVGLRVAD